MPPRKKQKLGGRERIGKAPAKVWPRYAAQIAALWVATFFAYSNSFDGGLVFDNAAIIGQDPRLRAATAENVGLIFSKEYWYPATNSGLYRPFTSLSYLLNYSVLGNGPHPAGYHVLNLALHDVNIALAYALGFLILGGSAPAFALADHGGFHAATAGTQPAVRRTVTTVARLPRHQQLDQRPPPSC